MTTIDDLARQLQESEAAHAIRRVAPGLGADPEKLLDSRSVRRDVAAGLAVAGGDENVARVVREAVADEPGRFRAAAATGGAGGTPGTGSAPGSGQPSPAQWTVEDVKRASPAQLVAAQDAGLLVGLGCGPRRQSRRFSGQ